jgi:dipeptidyl aminopeptidase/acylaminoacyl peptidase
MRLARLVAGAVAVHMAATWATAQPAARRPLELQDYFRLESVSTSAISPDGGRLAYIRSRIDRAADRRIDELWLTDIDARGEPRHISPPDASVSGFRWSVDGRTLAFAVRRAEGGSSGSAGAQGPSAGVWFQRVDRPGEPARQIEGVETLPWFSPDGKWMAFTRRGSADRRAGPPASQPSDAFEAELVSRFKGRAFDWMQYRFDGRGYLADPTSPAATPAAELHVMPAGGGDARALTNLAVDVRQAAWRPARRSSSWPTRTSATNTSTSAPTSGSSRSTGAPSG